MVQSLSLVLVVLALGGGSAQPEEARAAAAKAVSLHRAGDLEGALGAYRTAIGLDPGNAELRSNYGAALAALGRYREAVLAYKEALALVPDDARIRMNLALAYYKSAEIPSAAEQLQSLHQSDPADLRTTLLLADCRLQVGEYERVESLLKPVEAAHPEDRAVQYLLGMALIRGGKPREGGERVEKLLRGGDSAEAQYLLGSAAFMAKDYPRAVEHFKKALALEPSLPGLRSYQGQALLFTGDPEGAERLFREALRESPNDYEATFYLASILARQGPGGEARALAGRALELRPQSEEARALLAGLERGPASPEAAPADSPLVGKPAPDLELRLAGGGSLRLSSLRGRPLLLVFGSYTCPQLRHGAPEVNRLYERYRDRVRFLLVYIREAHPAGESWQSTINEREGVSLPEARSLAERAEHAAFCRALLRIAYEATLDDEDGRAEKAYRAFPSRVFVIDRAGAVTFSSALDAEVFRPEALAAALESAAR